MANIRQIATPPIVVGIDGTRASAAALSWAAAEAAAHRTPLLVVHVLDPRAHAAVYSPSTPPSPEPGAPDDILARIKQAVEQTPCQSVEQVFEIGVPAQILIQRAQGARMLVLGHALRHQHVRGGSHHEPALGPIARACVTNCTCPVVVVPEPVAGELAHAHHDEPLHGVRAIYPFQGRIPVAHG